MSSTSNGYSGAFSADKRQPTKRKRDGAFKDETIEAQSRITELQGALRKGDMYEVNRWYDLLGVSLEYLNANDPRREKR